MNFVLTFYMTKRVECYDDNDGDFDLVWLHTCEISEISTYSLWSVANARI